MLTSITRDRDADNAQARRDERVCWPIVFKSNALASILHSRTAFIYLNTLHSTHRTAFPSKQAIYTQSTKATYHSRLIQIYALGICWTYES